MPRLCSSLLLSLLIGSSASAVTMDWVAIGNPGNAGDPQSCLGCAPGTTFGTVPYTYLISKYEVTNAQYVEFLNAKATADPLGLYNTNMAFRSISGGITRTGSSGSYSYSAIAGRGDMPVTFVSFYDGLRFANWLQNGQGSGDTETGAYTLLGPYTTSLDGGATPSNGLTVTRNAGASFFLPSENEWYKAAYYDAGSTSYFDYPAGSDTQTTCATPNALANQASCNNAVGNLTIKGSYTGSASPYGTFDQGGNVWEWNEAIINQVIGGIVRGVRGGGFNTAPFGLAAANRGVTEGSGELPDTGFRVAMIPEPSTGLLVVTGLLGLAVRRRVRD